MKKETLIPILACLILGFVLQTVEVSLIPGRFGPDLLLILSLAAGWMGTLGVAGICGFSIGLLRDLSSGRVLGLEALCMTLGAFWMVFLRRFLPPDGTLSKNIAAFSAAIVARLAGLAAIRALGLALDPVFVFKEILPFDALWAFFLIWPIEALLSQIAKWGFRLSQNGNQKGRFEYGRW